MPAPTKSQAVRTAQRKAMAFIKSVKAGVQDRKTADYALALASQKYDDAEALARLAIAAKAQQILNRVAAAARAGQLDANALDRAKLREIAGEALTDKSAMSKRAATTAANTPGLSPTSHCASAATAAVRKNPSQSLLSTPRACDRRQHAA